MPTRWGTFQTIGFERDVSSSLRRGRRAETALAIVMGDVTTEDPPLLRIHSQCWTGEVLGSLRCDCRDQLDIAMQAIAAEGRGLLIYEHQEGRGIGLMAKLQAYALQDTGLDTVDANHALGFNADCRNYRFSIAILRGIGVRRVRILTNNPHKVRALFDAGIEVVDQIPCKTAPTPDSIAYLRAKQQRLGHTLSLGEPEAHRRDRSVG